MSWHVLSSCELKILRSRESAEIMAVSRPWEWPEIGICGVWSTTRRVVYSCPVCMSDPWVPVPDGDVRVCYGRRQGLEQTMSALWVKEELSEFSRHYLDLDGGGFGHSCVIVLRDHHKNWRNDPTLDIHPSCDLAASGQSEKFNAKPGQLSLSSSIQRLTP